MSRVYARHLSAAFYWTTPVLQHRTTCPAVRCKRAGSPVLTFQPAPGSRRPLHRCLPLQSQLETIDEDEHATNEQPGACAFHHKRVMLSLQLNARSTSQIGVPCRTLCVRLCVDIFPTPKHTRVLAQTLNPQPSNAYAYSRRSSWDSRRLTADVRAAWGRRCLLSTRLQDN